MLFHLPGGGGGIGTGGSFNCAALLLIGGLLSSSVFRCRLLTALLFDLSAEHGLLVFGILLGLEAGGRGGLLFALLVNLLAVVV